MASTILAVVLLALAAAAATAVDPTDQPTATAQQSPEAHQKELLDNLGFKELAMGIHSLYQFSPYPVTIFASSSDLLRRSRDSPLLLSDVYLVPGLRSAADLARLPNGSKLDLQGGRCLTIAAAGSKILVSGVEINRPDLFNDGRIAIHGLCSFIPSFYRISCGDDPLTKMLREVIPVLQHRGYTMLAAEVDGLKRNQALLHNRSYMTVFGLDDQSILADGSERYMRDMPFYIVPDHLLTHADLVRLPERTVLPTFDKGQRLVVTISGAAGEELLQINGMSIQAPDVFCNAKIAVHGITEPFSEDYHRGFTPVSLDQFVKFINVFLIATLVKLLVKLLVLRLADELNRMRRRAGGDGRGPHPRQD